MTRLTSILGCMTKMDAADTINKYASGSEEQNSCKKFWQKMFQPSFLAILVCFVAVQLSTVACNPLGPIAHLMHRSTDSSYSEAYVLTMTPNKMAFDPKALLRGLNSVKKTIGRMSTFDSNEYPHLDNPLQLGFVCPPTLPTIALRVESNKQHK